MNSEIFGQYMQILIQEIQQNLLTMQTKQAMDTMKNSDQTKNSDCHGYDRTRDSEFINQ